MSTIETIFLRVFSELERLQRAYALQYDLIVDTNADKRFGVQISRLDAAKQVTGARTFRQLTASIERAMQLLCYLYENAVSPSCAEGILQDLAAQKLWDTD